MAKFQLSTESSWHRPICMVVCMLECLLFGGTIFGWYNLVYIFKADGIYSHLCIPHPEINDSRGSRGSPYNTSSAVYDETTMNTNGVDYHLRTNLNILDNDVMVNSSIGYLHVGINSDVDPMEEPSALTCSSQEAYLSTPFTIGLLFMGIVSFGLGILFDKYGLLPTRMIGGVAAALGYILLALVNKDTSWLIFPGCSSLAISCAVLILTNTHIASMGGKLTSLAISIYGGGINSSGGVFWVIKILHDKGVPRMYSMSGLCGLLAIIFCSTLLLLPHYKVTSPVYALTPNQEDSLCLRDGDNSTPSKEKSAQQHADDDNDDDSKNQTRCGQMESVEKEAEAGGLRQCLLSWLNIAYLVWFSTQHVCIQFFLGTFNTRVSRIVDGNTAKVSHFTNILAYTQLCSLSIVLVTGGLMIWSRKSLLKKGMTGQQRAIATLMSVAMSCTSSFVLVIACINNTETFLYVAIVTSEFVRSTLYPTACAFIEISWPATHFGVLFGVAQLVVGIAALMQHPYTMWALANGFRQPDTFLMVTCIAALILPIVILIHHCTAQRRRPLVNKKTEGNTVELELMERNGTN